MGHSNSTISLSPPPPPGTTSDKKNQIYWSTAPPIPNFNSGYGRMPWSIVSTATEEFRMTTKVELTLLSLSNPLKAQSYPSHPPLQHSDGKILLGGASCEGLFWIMENSFPDSKSSLDLGLPRPLAWKGLLGPLLMTLLCRSQWIKSRKRARIWWPLLPLLFQELFCQPVHS